MLVDYREDQGSIDDTAFISLLIILNIKCDLIEDFDNFTNVFNHSLRDFEIGVDDGIFCYKNISRIELFLDNLFWRFRYRSTRSFFFNHLPNFNFLFTRLNRHLNAS